MNREDKSILIESLHLLFVRAMLSVTQGNRLLPKMDTRSNRTNPRGLRNAINFFVHHMILTISSSTLFTERFKVRLPNFWNCIVLVNGHTWSNTTREIMSLDTNGKPSYLRIENSKYILSRAINKHK